MPDDVAYYQMSVFGGLVTTPSIDRLAEDGLRRYASMHTTALWSPTRKPEWKGLDGTTWDQPAPTASDFKNR